MSVPQVASTPSFVGGLSTGAIGTALGRVIGFTFSFIVARTFSPGQFGHVVLVITVVELVAIVTKPMLQHGVAYFIGRHRGHTQELRSVLSELWTIALVTFAISAVVGSALLWVFHILSWTVLVVYAGSTLFYLYYGAASGYLATSRYVLAYVGSNLLQAGLVVAAIYGLHISSASSVLAIYGASYVIPIVLLQRLAPLNFHFRIGLSHRHTSDIVRFLVPVGFSHALYVGLTSLGVILLEHFSGNADTGAYGLTRTVASVFTLVPNGITIVLMPRLASMTSGRRRLVLLSLLICVGVSTIGLALYVLLYPWFIRRFFGADYFFGPAFGIVMAFNAILLGFYQVLAAAAVGLGRPRYETQGRVVILGLAIVLGIVFTPRWGAMGAAVAQLAALVIGMSYLTYLTASKGTTA